MRNVQKSIPQNFESKNLVHIAETHGMSFKEKILRTEVSKKFLYDMNEPIYIYILETTVIIAGFLLSSPLWIFNLFIEWPLYILLSRYH